MRIQRQREAFAHRIAAPMPETAQGTGEYKIIYHNTSPENAQKIIDSGIFTPNAEREVYAWFNSDPATNQQYGSVAVPLRVPVAFLDRMEDEDRGMFFGGMGDGKDDWAIMPDAIQREWILPKFVYRGYKPGEYEDPEGVRQQLIEKEHRIAALGGEAGNV